MQSARDAYHSALCTELAAHNWQWQPSTVYLGGGTPSLLDRNALGEIFSLIPRSRLLECTMECAPGTLTRALVRDWQWMGVNRVSLGVQSFIQRELNQVGRRHTASIVMEDVAALRAEGIGNINVDLIAGLPHQTAESWNESLDCLAMLDVPHVSVYIFELDEDSRLGKEMSEGGSRYGAAQAPSDDLTVELYRRAGERLAAAGCVRYEISNFAKPGFESLHNLTYWRREPYVGFGLDAHSFDGRQRWANSADLSNYMAAIREGTQPQSEAVDDEEEHFFVGLRMARGIQPTEAERRRFRGPIERWRTEGLLLDDGVTLRLSNRGILLSNEVLQEFIDD